ncbi:hypothetical protein B0H10DRAFT_1966026 [Mycena sp. CBHHK59/15]|nr:hypothetical protein B0H10DRAFT_1966026 [Mycena sp. CBHHK59/15]
MSPYSNFSRQARDTRGPPGGGVLYKAKNISDPALQEELGTVIPDTRYHMGNGAGLRGPGLKQPPQTDHHNASRPAPACMTSQAEDPFEFLIPSSEAGSDHEVNPSQHKEEERTRRQREECRFAAARAPVVAEAQDDSVTESESEEESPVLASILCRSGRVRPDVELSRRRIIEPVQVAGIVVIGRGREVQMAWIAWAKVASHGTSPRAEKYDALIVHSTTRSEKT